MRVGFIGLGDIGMPMAVRLVESGFEVVGLDRDDAKLADLVAAGGISASGAADFDGCSVVGLAVPDDEAVESVLVDDGLLDALGEGSTVLVHSTILPPTAVRLAEVARRSGVTLADAPVSGGASRARSGELTVMLGGDEPTGDAREVLAALGTAVSTGPIGAGAAVKLANQLSMLASLAALHEGLELASRFGADERIVLDVLESSTGDTWVARNWGFFDDLATTYDANGVAVRYRPWSKDLWDVVATARESGFSVPFAALLAQLLPDAVERHAAGARDRKEGST